MDVRPTTRERSIEDARHPYVDTNVDAAGRNARATVAGRGLLGFGGPQAL